jgi:hypothetical protein
LNEEFQATLASIRSFEREAAEILGRSDSAVTPRAFNAHEALKKVSTLSISQADLLKQAVRCIEVEVFRAAIVMAWAAVADLILELAVLEHDEVTRVRSWSYADKATLGESQAEFNVIETLHVAKVLTKGQKKSLQGMLHRRNECAHPSGYFPGANEALGFLDEAIHFSRKLSDRLKP